MDNYKKHVLRAGMIGSACTALLLAGCCDERCERDVVYAFNIPTEQAHCPANTVYVNVVTGEGIDLVGSGGHINLGGSGIVDRGGSGIVDRESQAVKQFCFESCISPSVPIDSNIYAVWTSSHEYIVAGNICAAPNPEPEADPEQEPADE